MNSPPEVREQEALEVATLWHQGVTNKFSGEPYIEHPKRVAEYVPLALLMMAETGRIEMEDFPDQVISSIRQAAFLHDVLEDTEMTEGEMSALFGPIVTALVIKVSKNHQIKGLYLEAIANWDPATVLKFADIMDNADPQRLAQVPDEFTRARLTKKYDAAAKVLGVEKELEQWKTVRSN